MIPKKQPPQQKHTNISSLQTEQAKFYDKILINLGLDGENYSSLYFEEKNGSNLAVKTKDNLDHQRFVKSRNGEKKKDDRRDRVLAATKNNFNQA